MWLVTAYAYVHIRVYLEDFLTSKQQAQDQGSDDHCIMLSNAVIARTYASAHVNDERAYGVREKLQESMQAVTDEQKRTSESLDERSAKRAYDRKRSMSRRDDL